MTHLFLSEPPLRFGEAEPPADLTERLQPHVDRGERGEAVQLFLREEVGLPDVVIEGIRARDDFEGLVGLAQTTEYDHLLVTSVSTPTASMLQTDVPVAILLGDPTMELLVTAANRLAEAMPGAELVVVPESQDHGVDPVGTAREMRARVS